MHYRTQFVTVRGVGHRFCLKRKKKKKKFPLKCEEAFILLTNFTRQMKMATFLPNNVICKARDNKNEK